MLLCAILIAAVIATAALAMADYWYTVCRYPDNTWQMCNFHGGRAVAQRPAASRADTGHTGHTGKAEP